MRAHPGGTADRLLAAIRREPGINLVTVAADAGTSVPHARRLLARYEAAGHVSSDHVGGQTLYWLEVETEPTHSARILARLAKGPAVYAELAAITAPSSPTAAMCDLERRGLLRIEERAFVRPGGGRVCRPNLYHAVTQ